MTEPDPIDVYRQVRERVSALATAADDAALDRDCPATPGWRVRDVVAHLGGATADIVAGNLDGVASDAWTQAQVDARVDWSIAEVLEEWARCSEVVEPLIPSIDPLMQTMLLADAVTHEHDVRCGLDAPGARESDGVALAFGRLAPALGAQRRAAGPLRIEHEDGVVVVGGDAEPTATLRATRFDVLRGAFGRRSLDQIAAWDWTGDVNVEAMVLSRFAPPRTSPLVE